jgi:hypothetical protein
MTAKAELAASDRWRKLGAETGASMFETRQNRE